MRQILQPVGGGPVRIGEVPTPSIASTEVLIRTASSIVSAGTERSMVKLAQSNLLAKARARPELVRQVVRRIQIDGISSTLSVVRQRLADDLPLGYSACGRVEAVGEAVAGIRVGDRVATAGAGWANHAELQAVPALLCAVVPETVSSEDAAFATIAAIALHGLRLADVGVGSKVVVQGAGLLGQLAARLAAASGCDVMALDVSEEAVAGARGRGINAVVDRGGDTTSAVLDWSRGRGADAVLVCAAGSSSAIVGRVPDLCRDRATVVIVGDVGLELKRTPFYERELSLRFARSYGPGRYERAYEQWGVDYPAGQIRWTEGRNLEAVLDLLAGDRRTNGKDLAIRRYAVVPLSPTCGLIGWVHEGDTLNQLIQEYRQRKRIETYVERDLIKGMYSRYEHLSLINKIEIFEYAMSQTKGEDLQRILWSKSPTSEIWLERRTNYTRSLAVMSMVGYILGLGDRHPSNLMLDRYTGKIIHIDFGDCFEVAMKRERCPEKVPFRLTRMLVNAMEISGIEGNFRNTCEQVMTVLRQNKDSLMAMLEVFLYEPLVSWRIIEQEKAGPSHAEDGEMTGSVREDIVKKLNAEGEMTELLNKKAIEVLDRVLEKLTGNDFPESRELNVPAQVDRLIKEARSIRNLAQSYIGWCPFW